MAICVDKDIDIRKYLCTVSTRHTAHEVLKVSRLGILIKSVQGDSFVCAYMRVSGGKKC